MMNGIGGEEGRNDWDDDLPEDTSRAEVEADAYELVPGQLAGDRLALGDEERLPWLESADDVDLDEEGSDTGRLIGFIVIGLIALAAIVGGIYWATHRAGPAGEADGSLIEASREPYKVAPTDPGGKTFAGTGDSAFAVSEGERPPANIAGSTAAPAPSATPSASAAPSASASAAPSAPSGVGVQVGAFSSNAAAEAAWTRLAAQHEALQGVSHRIVEGKADIGTVYRLQAVPGDAAAANALCARLQAGGLKCQVKR